LRPCASYYWVPSLGWSFSNIAQQNGGYRIPVGYYAVQSQTPDRQAIQF
jgi:hypothetical protein